MGAYNIIITGNKEIDKVLSGLKVQVNHKILQNAHASAAKATVNAAKLIAPEGPTGQLIDSIGVVRSSLGRADALGEIRVGPRRKNKFKGFAAHLVEFGTAERTLKGRGKYRAGTKRGIMPARPFMRPAWERTKNIVMTSINGEVGRHLYNYMKRTIKNAGQ